MEARFNAVDKRFEDVQVQMDRRFTAADKRFEDMHVQIDRRFTAADKRFDDLNSRFSSQFKFFTLGFTILAILMSLYNFFIVT